MVGVEELLRSITTLQSFGRIPQIGLPLHLAPHPVTGLEQVAPTNRLQPSIKLLILKYNISFKLDQAHFAFIKV